MKIEYTYLIEFKPTGQLYFGSKYGKNANPDTFWKDYFTSSNAVKDLIKEHGVDSFEILAITPYPDGGAYDAETKFLIENDCANSDLWLNESNNDYCLPHDSAVVKQRMIKKYGVTHNTQIPGVKEKQHQKRLETVLDPDWKEMNRQRYFQKTGVYHSRQIKENQEKVEATVLEKYGVKCVFESEEIKDKIKRGFIEKYGMHPKQTDAVKQKYRETMLKKHGVDSYQKTDEFKAKITETWEQKPKEVLEKHRNASKSVRANDPVIQCIHCRKVVKGLGTFNQWHGDNCKLKPKELK